MGKRARVLIPLALFAATGIYASADVIMNNSAFGYYTIPLAGLAFLAFYYAEEQTENDL